MKVSNNKKHKSTGSRKSSQDPSQSQKSQQTGSNNFIQVPRPWGTNTYQSTAYPPHSTGDPIDMWFNEPLKDSPYNAIYSVPVNNDSGHYTNSASGSFTQR